MAELACEPVEPPFTAALEAAAGNRRRSIRLAILTSILSKGANMLIMFMALPLAFKVLGEQRAAVYGAIQSFMWLVALSDMGIGSGLSRRVAEGMALNDRVRTQRAISTGIIITLGLTLVVLVAGCLVLSFVPVTAIFGPTFAPHSAEMTEAAWLGLFCFAVLVVLYQMERIREGVQEVHVTNAFGAVLNLTIAASLIIGFEHWPRVSFLVASLYGLQILFLGSNVGMMMRRPWLRPGWKCFDRVLAGSMLKEGFLLFLAGSVAPTILREAPRFCLGKYDSAAAAASCMILIQLGLFGLGMVMMVSRPLYPAFSDAAARGDVAWLQSARRKMNLCALPLALVIITGLATMGPWFIDQWIKGAHRSFTWQECAIYGVSFCALVWSHMHYIMLASTHHGRPVAVIAMIEATLAVVISAAGIHEFGLDGALAGCAIASVLTSVWMLPLAARRCLRSMEANTRAAIS